MLVCLCACLLSPQRGDGGEAVGNVPPPCQRVDGCQQDGVALRERILGILHGRDALQRGNQRVVALDLLCEVGDDAIVLQHLAAAPVQLMVEAGGLLAGVGHVEGVLGALRIEHQPYLFALLHVLDQLLVLCRSLLFIAGHESLLLLVVGL